MHDNQYHLLKTRRFLPLFITQFLNAFNDNIYKNAMVILLTYKLITGTPQHEQLIVTLAAGLFILPFFLFSATAGQLADKYEKSLLIRIIKFFEIVIVSIGGYALHIGQTPLLMFTLFLMGTHSTFFGPLKYAILPEHLAEDELIGGNAFIEASTFLSIMIGTILGGVLIMFSHGEIITSVIMISVATTGWISSFFIPKAEAAQPHLHINKNMVTETFQIVKYAFVHREVYLAILGISWFWLVGGTFISQFPTFAKDVLGVQPFMVSIFFSTFSIGIAIGSMTVNKLLKGEVNAKYIPVAIFVMSIFMADLHFASPALVNHTGTLISSTQFLSTFAGWRVMLDLFLLSVAGGIYIVPLYAILQTRSDVEHRARMIAANNIVNAMFMVLSALLVILFLTIHFTITQIFLTIAILNVIVAFYIIKLVPHTVMQSFVKWLLVSCYRTKVHGLNHLKKLEGRVIIVANHTSFIDVLLIAAYLPYKLTFAINTHMAKQWWIKPFLSLVEAFPIDPSNPMSTKSLIKVVKENKKLVIFPEGRLTVTGSLMKIYEGPGLIANQADAQILPIRIEGAQYTPFTRLRGKVPINWFPRITLTILPPRKFSVPETIHGRERRRELGLQLYDLMSDMLFQSSDYKKHLFMSLIEARQLHKGLHIILEDIERNPISYDQLIQRAFTLGKHIRNQTQSGEIVGILLPNMSSTVITFFALQAFSRVPAMLNYSAGPLAVYNAVVAADIQRVYTSREFVESAKLQKIIDQLEVEHITVHYLEDEIQNLSTYTKWFGILAGRFPRYFFLRNNEPPKSKRPAVVMFTSGSEGAPKGVVLSHGNIQANRYQLSSRIAFNAQDIAFNALPMFHSFGLNIGTLLPILSGIRTFIYPSPLHFRIIPELIYDTNATITFATDTFLAGYAKYAHPYDCYSLRYVLAGAERLKDSTRQEWINKFGIRILEGYGATETSPVLATNTPMQNTLHTVGRLLPGIEAKIVEHENITTGGRLFVKGPNIMIGYLTSEQPGHIITPPNGWHDTGDIVNIDNNGFISILDRAKRFAKIGGEMISLSAVENQLYELWPNTQHAVITVPDEKKGEAIVLCSTQTDANIKSIREHFRTLGVSELMIPRDIHIVEEFPRLATGKVDYPALKKQIINLHTKTAKETLEMKV